MKAAVIYEHGGAGSIKIEENFPDPKPGPDEVVLRVKATSLNYHDVFTRQGMPGIKVPMPCIMGIDLAGEIVEIGANVKEWNIGDRVLVDPIDRVGPGGLIGELRHGGLAEYCKVPVHHLIGLPDDVPYEFGACLPVAYGTALRMMYTIGGIQAGEKVLILGASGGVGTCCVQLAKAVNAEVIACASNDEKLRRLTELGADHVVDYTKEDLTKWVWARFGKPKRREFAGGVDVVVNFTGGDTWVRSLKMLRRQGKLLTCGATAGFGPKEDIRYIWTFELNIRGSNGWMRDELLKLIKLVQDGSLKPIIYRELPLSEVNEAFRLIEEREVFGKVVVRP